MTPEEIRAALAIDGLDVRTSDNGEFYWLNVTREFRGQRQSWAKRVRKDPSPSDIESISRSFADWEREENT